MIQKIKDLVRTKPKIVYIALDIPMFALTFAFVVMTGNALDAETMGIFNSALGIFTVFSTVGLALQSVIARRVAAAERVLGTRDFFIASIAIAMWTVSPFFLPPGILPSLKSVDLSGTLPFILILSCHVGVSFCRGILQGTERFYSLWAAQASEHVARIVILGLFMGGVVTLKEAWVAVVVGNFTHLLFGLFMMPRTVWSEIWNQQDKQNGLGMEIFAVMMTNFALNYLLSVDLIVAGERLGDAGGAYATANKFGRLLYFAGASVAIVILPLFARAKSTPGLRSKILLGTIVLVPISGLLSPVGAYILDPFIQFAFPPEVVPSIELLSWTMFANFALASIQLFITWHVAQRTLGLSWLLAGCCGMLAWMLSSGEADAIRLIQITSGIVWVTTILLAGLAYFQPVGSDDEATTQHSESDVPVESTDVG